MSTTLYTITLDEQQMERLEQRLSRDLWTPYKVDYARFAYKGNRVNVVAYKSGKVVIQGKQTQDFVQNILEPEITGSAQLGYEEVHYPEWFELHAGLDECGKGDFFGPLVTACVVAQGEAIRTWRDAGLQDSKQVSDKKIFTLEALIKKTPGVGIDVAYCSMEKYNTLMAKPKANLNLFLAWLHARSLEGALKRLPAPRGLLDQFSKRRLVERYYSEAFKAQHPEFQLEMRTHAESDPVVAAASVIARATFLRLLKDLSAHVDEPLLKGASANVKKQAQRLVAQHGPDVLKTLAKCHFRTAAQVLEG